MKVWNVTDAKGSKPTTLVLFGKPVGPGKFVDVDADRLKNAHKIKKDAEAGLVFIGDKLPGAYTAGKATPMPRFPRKGVRAHGEGVTPAPKKAKAPPAPKVETKTEVKVEDKSEKSGSKRGK